MSFRPRRSKALLVKLSILAGVFLGAIAVGYNLCFLEVVYAQEGEIVISDTLSKFVRSNAKHFWQTMKTSELNSLEPYLDFKGIVAGDPHMGNFAPIPVVQNGQYKMAFLSVDFDDAGVGPFILDFIRYEVSIKAVFQDIKKKDLEEAYLRGLSGQALAAPMQLNQILSVTYNQYQMMADEYTDRKTTNKTKPSSFKLKTGEIEEYNAKFKLSSIEALFPGEKVVDVAIRPADESGGGSALLLRIWVLVQEGSGRTRIMELKEYSQTSMMAYEPQALPEQWLQSVRAAFWPGLTGATYDLVTLEGTRFWLRQKAVTLIDVPYTSSKSGKLAYAESLALYDANQLGLAHGRQPGGSQFLALAQADRKAFHKATEEVVNDYLALASQL